MKRTLLRNARAILPNAAITTRDVLIEGATIRDIAPAITVEGPQHTIDGDGALLTPGLIDLHTHGVGVHLYEHSVEDLIGGCALLPRFGVTTVLPTLYRALGRESFDLLGKLAEAARRIDAVHIPGFHLEGPFLALAGAGAMTLHGDVRLLNDLFDACDGFVRAMSISPETPDILPVIEELVRRGVVPFITHTQASAEQTQRAIDAGARHATHFYDVFPIPVETEPGVRQVGAVEAILADERCTVDFICDGVHAPPIAIRATLTAKGWDRVACTTDSNLGAGLPAAHYDHPWGYRIRAEPNNAARIANPTHPEHDGLAGSTLTMNVGVSNLLRWFSNDGDAPWTAATSTPARIARLDDAGRIEIDRRADLVLWNDDFTPRLTLCGGRITHGQPLDTSPEPTFKRG